MTDVTKLAEADAAAERAGPTDEELRSIAGLAEKQRELEGELDELDRRYREKKQELRRVREVDLPQAMNEAGVSSFTLGDGTRISVEAGVDAHVSKKNQDAAYKWLKNNGFGDLIRRQATVDVGRDEAAYERYVAACREAGFEPEVKEAVHPQTLKAFVREREREGDVAVPEELFGVFRYEKATVEPPK